MGTQSNVQHIGKTAVFYIPSNKLSESTRKRLHDFFVMQYDAYTHESSDIKGYWVDKGEVVRDQHERYEISFGGNDKLDKLVNFLADICREVEEAAIYLTVDNESYLVRRRT